MTGDIPFRIIYTAAQMEYLKRKPERIVFGGNRTEPDDGIVAKIMRLIRGA